MFRPAAFSLYIISWFLKIPITEIFVLGLAGSMLQRFLAAHPLELQLLRLLQRIVIGLYQTLHISLLRLVLLVHYFF